MAIGSYRLADYVTSGCPFGDSYSLGTCTLPTYLPSSRSYPVESVLSGRNMICTVWTVRRAPTLR